MKIMQCRNHTKLCLGKLFMLPNVHHVGKPKCFKILKEGIIRKGLDHLKLKEKIEKRKKK